MSPSVASIENVIEFNNIIVANAPVKYTIDDTLQDRDLLNQLKIFAKMEHTEENLEFLEAVNEFKRKRDPKSCETIIDRFVLLTAPKQINISHRDSDRIMEESVKYKYAIHRKLKKCDSAEKKTSFTRLLMTPRVSVESDVHSIHSDELDYSIFDGAYEVVRRNVVENTLVRFNNSNCENLRNSKLHINPSQFRRGMIVISFFNFLFFVTLAIFVLVVSKQISTHYVDDVEVVRVGKNIQLYDLTLTTMAGKAAIYAFAGEPYDKFVRVYNETVPLIDSSINAIELKWPNLRYSQEVNEANDELVELETKVFDLVYSNSSKEALDVLES
eukprot:Awhi_evm1s4945